MCFTSLFVFLLTPSFEPFENRNHELFLFVLRVQDRDWYMLKAHPMLVKTNGPPYFQDKETKAQRYDKDSQEPLFCLVSLLLLAWGLRIRLWGPKAG
jgi:hypothetical protein